MANEPPKKNVDPDARVHEIGPDPDTVRAAMRERDANTPDRETPERRMMDAPDMGEDEHPDEGHDDRGAPAPSTANGVAAPRGGRGN
jgi:hypothetical protein